ncbi:peptidoglycan-binding protein [Aquabacterium olei]|uniref:Lysozyme n=1 Tax=Aquabacterium olei TaxID=1296669 RepID=A0A2U8FV11_9BURK|nr:LysM peptidoglycan-binding domain-containing protein [Aquabacterium olei]AWI54912.1 peptidoglycan-binding protein [Aquabacterium olei]
METNKSKISLLLVDILDQPIKGLQVEIRTADRVWHRATTNASGVLEFTAAQGRDLVVHVEHWVTKQMKPVAKFFAGLDDMAIKLVSPKVKTAVAAEPTGAPGPYLRGMYVVRKGDTLSGIAKAHGIGVDYLAKINDIHNKNALSIGQVLKVPPVKNRSTQPQPHAKPVGTPPHSATDVKNAPRTANGKAVPAQNENNANGKPVARLPGEQSAVIFPLKVKPLNEKGGSFSNRSWSQISPAIATTFGGGRRTPDGGRRLHAGRDLYARDLTDVYAVAPGKVLRVAPFYMKTDQVSVRHKTSDGREFIVRYGELDPESIRVKKGDDLMQGQLIGKTGILRRSNGEKLIIADGKNVSMLHFELYSGAAGLDNADNLSTTTGEYRRRSDLIDPLPILQEGYINSFRDGASTVPVQPGERKPVSQLRLSAEGEAFIKNYEKLRLDYYEDHLHYCTVGWGHLTGGKTTCSSQSIKIGEKIPLEEAQRLFDEDRKAHERYVKEAITAPLYQHEFDALCSLAFNIGNIRKKSPTLCSKVNSGQYKEAAKEFLDITNGGTPGLVKRRNQENAMFLRAEYDSTH